MTSEHSHPGMVRPYPGHGERYMLRHDVDRFPHFLAPAGALGTIVSADREMIALHMDNPLPGSEDWDNEIHWYPINGDDFYRDAKRVVS